MNVDHGLLYDLSSEEQRRMFEADDRAVPVGDQVAADLMRGQFERLQAKIDGDKLREHFARQDRSER